MALRIGRVEELYLFPIKGMSAERKRSITILANGIEGDRVAAFAHTTRADAPLAKRCLTSDEFPDLVRYVVDTMDRSVRIPAGDRLYIDEETLLEHLKCASGFPDLVLEYAKGPYGDKESLCHSRPVSLVGRATLDSLTDPSPTRYRMNIVADFGDKSFCEDTFVGKDLRIGSATIHIDKRTPRCPTVDIDPRSGLSLPGTLKAIGKANGGHLGVYASVVVPGMVKIRDEIFLD